MELISMKINKATFVTDVFFLSELNEDTVVKNIACGLQHTKYAIVTDNRVNKLYGVSLLERFKQHGLDVILIEFDEGECNKTRYTKEMIEKKLLENRFDRKSCIIALGGGVVGDLAGFVAATYMRGISVIQIPTTLIAQGDSSVGGKTAIDVPEGKNLIGAFHHPEKVFICPTYLQTLDRRNCRSGLVEILKHGFLWDQNFVDYLYNNMEIILDSNHGAYCAIMLEILKRNLLIKKEIVTTDSQEVNLRKALNYGHTIGHSIESLSHYTLTHGEAIALGIICEALIACKLGYLSYDDFNIQLNILKRLELNVSIPSHVSTADIIKGMYLDKKAKKSCPEFVFLQQVGKLKYFSDGSISTCLEEEELKKSIDEARTILI